MSLFLSLLCIFSLAKNYTIWEKMSVSMLEGIICASDGGLLVFYLVYLLEVSYTEEQLK